jgi:hypothetical protein
LSGSCFVVVVDVGFVGCVSVDVDYWQLSSFSLYFNSVSRLAVIRLLGFAIFYTVRLKIDFS